MRAVKHAFHFEPAIWGVNHALRAYTDRDGIYGAQI